ncbi:uncharacterized protein LOC124202294 [Daphnia pulex]|uniref:uncharacterized protein LOC124202294 n=1 Tax=Daphnia pulex TaxID=6669 RepID=UPI001EDE240D|nr:uncharacterized protein LOC124202294 [Daphnia pulex]
MAFSTSISFFLVATVCCLVVNAAGANLWPLPSAAHRQFNNPSMYMLVPPYFNYYQPYGGQFVAPTAQGEIDPKISLDDLELTGRQNSETIRITPVDTECIKTDVATNGYAGCTKGSRAPSGTIIAEFGVADQVGIVALVPNAKRYSKLKITCADVTAANVYTTTSKITAPADTPVTETKQTQVVMVSTGAATVTCSWEASA